MAAVTVADLVSLIPALAVADGIVLGAVTLATGWHVFRDRTPARYWRGTRAWVPDSTGQDPEDGPTADPLDEEDRADAPGTGHRVCRHRP